MLLDKVLARLSNDPFLEKRRAIHDTVLDFPTESCDDLRLNIPGGGT